jgi:hypothetical protein
MWFIPRKKIHATGEVVRFEVGVLVSLFLSKTTIAQMGIRDEDNNQLRFQEEVFRFRLLGVREGNLVSFTYSRARRGYLKLHSFGYNLPERQHPPPKSDPASRDTSSTTN